jgi:hypothetical protein
MINTVDTKDREEVKFKPIREEGEDESESESLNSDNDD